MPNLDDPAALLPALRCGDPDAWRVLFETYAEPLYLYAFHHCGGSAAIAEDVRQETFLTAIEKIHSYRGDSPLFGWLCGIARHKALDAARRQKREVQPPNAMLEEEDETPEMLSDEPQPDEWAERAEGKAEVVQALWSLPETYRKALIWRYAQEEPVERIAIRLQKTYKSVESLLSRARAALREQLLERERERNPHARTR